MTDTWRDPRGQLRMAVAKTARTMAKRALSLTGAPGFARVNDEVRKVALFADFTRWKGERARPAFTDQDLRGPVTSSAVREQLYRYLLDRYGLADEPIAYYEFGVAGGVSLRWWVAHAAHPDSAFVGFDTFQGLPENWRNKPKGTFSTGGATPDIDDTRVSYQVGLFQETVPPLFAGQTPPVRAIYHFDADLYSSTLLCLFSVSSHLKSGDLLIFDEFSDLLHEFRAWLDFTSAFDVEYEVVGAIGEYTFVAIEIG